MMIIRARQIYLVLMAVILLFSLSACGQLAPEKQASLSGNLKMSGSTSVQPLAEELAQTFMKKYPKVQITITGGGSGVGIKDAAEGK
jgi:ABC-type phosphate transport system, periplasmic component